MKLTGLGINFLGDSITEGHGTTAESKVFHQVIKEKCGLTFAYNYGIGGTRIARQRTTTAVAPRRDLYFALRAETMERTADAVVVFGGTNDYGHGDAYFGKIDGGEDDTFCGSVHALITKLKKDFPRAEIIFMTPLHRKNEDNPSEPDGKTLRDYAEAIRAICKARGVKIIDLFEINPLDPADTVLVPDGLHPSDEGHAVLAEVVAAELMKL